MTKTCDFNATRDYQFAQDFSGFDQVLHIFNADWHGVRAASAYAPGQKLAISERDGLDGEAIRHVFGIISKYRINRVVFQAYSHVASGLCESIHRQFGNDVEIYVITHVTSTQFEAMFEMEMQALLLQQLSKGVVKRLGSVKPRFNSVIPAYWPETILNFSPNIGTLTAQMNTVEGTAFVPIENSWRKNLYTNMLAVQDCDAISTVFSVNFPTGLEKIRTMDKLSLTSFKRGPDLLGFMASTEVLLNVTLAECQPMTQLEALAVGTPCMTAPLRLHEFEDDPLVKLTEVESLDSPYFLTQALDKVIAVGRQEDDELQEMIDGHLERRNLLAALSYAEFLSL